MKKYDLIPEDWTNNPELYQPEVEYDFGITPEEPAPYYADPHVDDDVQPISICVECCIPLYPEYAIPGHPTILECPYCGHPNGPFAELGSEPFVYCADDEGAFIEPHKHPCLTREVSFEEHCTGVCDLEATCPYDYCPVYAGEVK